MIRYPFLLGIDQVRKKIKEKMANRGSWIYVVDGTLLGETDMRMLMSKAGRDYCGGALMFLLGLGAMVRGRSYTVGSLTDMGPGFFPVALGAILALCGVALVIVTKVSASKGGDDETLPPEWVAWSCILGGVAAFVILGKYGGLVPATFAAVFISALGDRQNTFRSALMLSVSMVALAVVVFWWALQLQFPLFTWG